MWKRIPHLMQQTTQYPRESVHYLSILTYNHEENSVIAIIFYSKFEKRKIQKSSETRD